MKTRAKRPRSLSSLALKDGAAVTAARGVSGEFAGSWSVGMRSKP